MTSSASYPIARYLQLLQRHPSLYLVIPSHHRHRHFQALIALNVDDGKPRGFAHVEFPDAESRDIAIRCLNGIHFQGRILRACKSLIPFKSLMLRSNVNEDRNGRGGGRNRRDAAASHGARGFGRGGRGSRVADPRLRRVAQDSNSHDSKAPMTTTREQRHSLDRGFNESDRREAMHSRSPSTDGAREVMHNTPCQNPYAEQSSARTVAAPSHTTVSPSYQSILIKEERESGSASTNNPITVLREAAYHDIGEIEAKCNENDRMERTWSPKREQENPTKNSSNV